MGEAVGSSIDYTPLYEKGIKKIKNIPMGTTEYKLLHNIGSEKQTVLNTALICCPDTFSLWNSLHISVSQPGVQGAPTNAQREQVKL